MLWEQDIILSQQDKKKSSMALISHHMSCYIDLKKCMIKDLFFYVSTFKIHVESDYFTFQLGSKLWL